MSMYNEKELRNLAESIGETDTERAEDYSKDLVEITRRQVARECDGAPLITAINLTPRDRRAVVLVAAMSEPDLSVLANYLAGLDMGIVVCLALQKLGRCHFKLEGE